MHSENEYRHKHLNLAEKANEAGSPPALEVAALAPLGADLPNAGSINTLMPADRHLLIYCAHAHGYARSLIEGGIYV
jgi:hypothetical protein